jgi:hypothetical protein
VRAPDDDRDVGAVFLDLASDLDGSRILDGHTRDADEVRSFLADALHDLVHGQIVELPVEEANLVARGSERARDVGDPERREAGPVPVELTARRGMDERDLHRSSRRYYKCLPPL